MVKRSKYMFLTHCKLTKNVTSLKPQTCILCRFDEIETITRFFSTFLKGKFGYYLEITCFNCIGHFVLTDRSEGLLL